MKRWVISDTHFGHLLMSKLRGYGNAVEEMNRVLIHNWELAIDPADTVYHLGDVVMNRRYLEIIPTLPGRKILVKGNHDGFPLKDYVRAGFEDIRACVVHANAILTHIPIHPDELGRFNLNIHGHLHDRKLADLRYKNVSVEQTDYKPVDLASLVAT